MLVEMETEMEAPPQVRAVLETPAPLAGVHIESSSPAQVGRATDRL